MVQTLQVINRRQGAPGKLKIDSCANPARPKLCCDDITPRKHLMRNVEEPKISRSKQWIRYENMGNGCHIVCPNLPGKIASTRAESKLLNKQKKKSFLSQIVTGDEKWILYDNPKRRKRWADPGQGTTFKLKANVRGQKVTLCVWRDQGGILFHQYQERERVAAQVSCLQN
ncbi:hypothetical protein M513_02812 [Trichuris suis]|uniref:Uncharacterized protein n=1 Tax=Trichuris suis TaxID=68888 RepID=A0A085MGL1_9BILA|nr:hypothetical protein M513_02812 [Trichuris suis]